MKGIPILTIACFLAAGIHETEGARLNPRQVSADAHFVLHLDTEAFEKTELGQYITKQIAKDDSADSLMNTFAPTNTAQKLSGITLYGNDSDSQVILLQGRFDTNRLVTLARTFGEFKTEPFGTHTLFSWKNNQDTPSTSAGRSPYGWGRHAGQNKDSRLYGCMAAPSVIVLGDTAQQVRNAVNVIDGQAKNMAQAHLLPGLAGADTSTFLIASADTRKMPDMQQNAGPLGQAGAVLLTFKESKGALKGLLELTAKDDETAATIQAFAQAMTGMAMLNAQRNPAASKFMNALQLNRQNNRVTVHLNYPVTEIIRLLEDAADQK
jgi:hypothetical protein